ncbi:conserved hypothetical protein [Theileria orientalis strain Shintoku]|uniref:Non-structural maintenance of chromosomes element 4 n=1 Tax=Theileria orientalis strain Shintoku TaxID=869250 RepID=J4C2U8_THEOR|nr:conserved hypothetical protein [Theileria orientalis strain Shintoku]BAM39316.1 conserved hypothetical protein [Theileria orientalis strain Shintoku]|eukprot:XP_009689617.1 conserved hypothetical protein [Theileria orientalis strain Shintoku]
MNQQAPDVESLRDVCDELTFDQIDSIIENLTAGNLSSFLNNEKLNEALENDAYLINNVRTQTGITKSCEHGQKVSSIIKQKALKLNEATALELLDTILNLLLEKFGAEREVTDARDPSGKHTRRCLDFALMSKHFPSGALALSSLSWDSLPLSGLIAHEYASQQRQRRPAQTFSNPASYKELDALVEYEQQLETKERVERMKRRIGLLSAAAPVDFWEFVLDRDPQNGFNNTCFNLYSLTFLATNGDIEVFKSPRSDVLIRARSKNDSNSVNFQSIVTGWCYDQWLKLVDKYST